MKFLLFYTMNEKHIMASYSIWKQYIMFHSFSSLYQIFFLLAVLLYSLDLSSLIELLFLMHESQLMEVFHCSYTNYMKYVSCIGATIFFFYLVAYVNCLLKFVMLLLSWNWIWLWFFIFFYKGSKESWNQRFINAIGCNL